MTALDSPEWRALIDYLDEKIGKPLFGKNIFRPDDDLHHDLDLNPPAIASLIGDWSEKFGVDISDFDLASYYPASLLNTPHLLWTTLKAPFSRTARETLGGWRITLSMLESSIRLGKWTRD